MVNQYIGSAIQQRVFYPKIGVAPPYLYAPTSCQSRNKSYSENLDIKAPLTPAICVQVTNEELDELFYI